MRLFIDPKFRIAFTICTVSGWVAGILLEGKSILGKAEPNLVLTVIFLGGVAGALAWGSSWKSRAGLFVLLLPYVAVLGQLTAFYLHIRDWVFIPELLIPCALAISPIIIIHMRLTNKNLPDLAKQ